MLGPSTRVPGGPGRANGAGPGDACAQLLACACSQEGQWCGRAPIPLLSSGAAGTAATLSGPWSLSCVPHSGRARAGPWRGGAPRPPVDGGPPALRGSSAEGVGQGEGTKERRGAAASRQGTARPFQHPHPGSGAEQVKERWTDSRMSEVQVLISVMEEKVVLDFKAHLLSLAVHAAALGLSHQWSSGSAPGSCSHPWAPCGAGGEGGTRASILPEHPSTVPPSGRSVPPPCRVSSSNQTLNNPKPVL